MSTYRYQPGDRPLDGYTVRAPAGRGGFGEVYFAESDAGREVALKALYVNQGYDEIELRGIRHCMNLKSPHLVSIFDVKTAEDSTPFVVMEYVAGPSLRDLLNDSPEGLGPDKAAFFLREVAKGLSHLHGYGVVHRDLKPANIFYEDGYVKIGDYGLSKLMTADPVASQTVTVGTVHYMAPEIGAGKYDKSIDLYALGCLLYEMLTGRVPYSGDSPSEVLMKHLQAEPELDDVPEAFAKVIRKALQKDPADRYASATEMVEDLFGTEHVRNSVSQLNADELSVIAKRVGRKLETAALPPASPIAAPPRPPQAPRSNASLASAERHWPQHGRGLFAILTVMLALLAATFTGIGMERHADEGFWSSLFMLMLVGPASTWAVTRGNRYEPEPLLGTRLGFAIRPILSHALIALPFILLVVGGGASDRVGTLLVTAAFFSALVTACVYWPQHTHPDRTTPFSPGLWVGLGLAAALPTLVFAPEAVAIAFALPVIIALGAQLVRPTTPLQPITKTHPATPAMNAAVQASAPAPSRPAPTARPEQPPSPQTGQPALPENTSRHSRLAAILLCAVWIVMPLGGLHRFYVGKWFTGILWLCTFGFLGIGQLIDGILILCGAFNDSQGKPLIRWELAGAPQDRSAHVTRKSAAVKRTWTPRIRGRVNPFAMMLHLFGILLLLVGLGLMVPVWFSVPELINELPVFAEFRDDVGDGLGYDGWPLLAGRVLFGAALVVLVVGTLCVAVARRGSLAHTARAAFGGGAMLCGGAMLVAHNPKLRAVRSWQVGLDLKQYPLDAQLNPLFNVDAILSNALGGPFFVGLVWLGMALALLMIPARRSPSTLTQQAQEVAS
ncbi:MAG: protein kinase [Planctomycetota bacterium]